MTRLNPDDVKLILTPLAMRTPNKKCVYQKSKLRRPKTISETEFRERFTCQRIKIASGDDLGEWIETDAYGYGLDCWYLVDLGFIDETASEYEPGFARDSEGNWAAIQKREDDR